MAITRTPIIDDDGTGTTGTVIDNAWKQELYNQIDGAVSAITYGTFTAVDISGGLGTVGTGQYANLGRMWMIFLSITYPANANGAQVAIGGLPFTQAAAFFGALYEGFGAGPYRTYINANTNVLTILNHATGAALTNAQLSGQSAHFHGICLST